MDYIQIIIQFLGGLGLFLLGMEQLGAGTKKLAGRRLRYLLEKFTATKGGGVLFGILLTLLFQSSSAASVVLVGFVNVALLEFTKTMAVMLGTGIGTTITAQIIAFKIGLYALALVGVGFFLRAFTKGQWSYSGQIIMALGILFYGMELMSDGMSPLKDIEHFTKWISYLKNPLIGIVVGAVFTALIQSSAAFIGILMTLTSVELLTITDSLPLILGANIGTTFTALLASINASLSGKRLALANTMFRIAGVLLVVWFLGAWEQFTFWISGNEASPERLMANAHTIFNVIMTLVFLPVTGIIGALVIKMTPEKKKQEFKMTNLGSQLFGTPEIAIPFLQKEVQNMGDIVIQMVEKSLTPFFERDPKVLDQIHDKEQKVDVYREEINRFLVKYNENESIEIWSSEVYRLLHVVNELEQIADIVAVNIARQGEKWINNNIKFSQEGGDELREYHQSCIKQLARAMNLLRDWQPERALKMKKKYRKYALMAFDLEMQHYKRLLTPSSQSVESSKAHMEILNLLRMINSHATNIGRMALMEEEGFGV